MDSDVFAHRRPKARRLRVGIGEREEPDPELAAAGLWTTPTDLARFAIAIQRSVRGDYGALLAQERLRHKSIKQPFRTLFWLTLVLNIGGLLWLLTPQGSSILNSIVDRLI